MLVSQDPAEIDVNLALYNNNGGGAGEPGDSEIVNQHLFVVYYLKLESLTLGNVEGKRAGHDEGPFTPPNPVWDIGTNASPNASPDGVTGTVNVSADTLLRARVKGWFMGDRLSTRLAATQDADPTHPGIYMYTLPAGRWVLPDDWAVLDGPNRAEMRMHWDIMNNPGTADVVDPMPSTPVGQGDYYDAITNALVAQAPVIGPFTPELEIPTFDGYNPNTVIQPYRYPTVAIARRWYPMANWIGGMPRCRPPRSPSEFRTWRLPQITLVWAM
jgi:hypothetical protein